MALMVHQFQTQESEVEEDHGEWASQRFEQQQIRKTLALSGPPHAILQDQGLNLNLNLNLRESRDAEAKLFESNLILDKRNQSAVASSPEDQPLSQLEALALANKVSLQLDGYSDER